MFFVRSVCLFVCLSVCLFVCLSVRLLANLRTDFDEIFWRSRAWLKDQVIQFWWRSGSRFGSGSPKSEIRILQIGGGLCSLSIDFLFYIIYVRRQACQEKKFMLVQDEKWAPLAAAWAPTLQGTHWAPVRRSESESQ